MAASNAWRGAILFAIASSRAASMSPSTPVFLRAEIMTTGQPRLFSSEAASILSPLLSTRSAMLSATTTGTPVSMTCNARYRLRSKLVASITWITTSGSPPMR